jgi:hypothetical protein
MLAVYDVGRRKSTRDSRANELTNRISRPTDFLRSWSVSSFPGNVDAQEARLSSRSCCSGRPASSCLDTKAVMVVPSIYVLIIFSANSATVPFTEHHNHHHLCCPSILFDLSFLTPTVIAFLLLIKLLWWRDRARSDALWSLATLTAATIAGRGALTTGRVMFSSQPLLKSKLIVLDVIDDDKYVLGQGIRGWSGPQRTPHINFQFSHL